MKNAGYWKEKLKLQKHPEGGFYGEIYRNQLEVNFPNLDGKRNVATSIYYLLENGDKSHFHRLRSDELWYFHAGDPLTVFTFQLDGNYKEFVLGDDPERDQHLQLIIPAGTIFGASIENRGKYCLMGCMVNPGFDFEDFELMERTLLLEKYPTQSSIIKKFTF